MSQSLPGDPPAEPPAALLDELVFQSLERIEREGAAVLEQVYAAHPEQASALRARIEALAAAGLVEGLGSEPLPERLGDFRLLTRLGGGGMGVVYAAEQTSLQRRVALKLIRPEQLYFPGARERFRREVAAAARLSHPGIAPVHAVGEERGLPYFAMELIAGAAVDEVLSAVAARHPSLRTGRDLLHAVAALAADRGSTERGNPEDWPWCGSWTQACLWIGRELAQALEHAHQRGVLHRDVKPSNVMLTPGGRVLLVDFGLASSAGVARMTRTGAQPGSLPYMAPEQVRGEAAAIGPRTDVYGVGATLYEMLSLRPAFGSTSALELSRQILDARPARLGALVPGLPRDVETVVAAAMAPEPERRYASAADLARDLTNLLERRPITARPISPLGRTVRWVRRSPAAAAALFLALLLVIGGPILFGLQQAAAARAQSELAAAVRDERDEARLQRVRAEHNYERALAAVDTMLSHVGDSRLANVPRAAAVRRELLEEALAFYRGFLAERPHDQRLRFEAARAELRCARVLALLGRGEEAERSFATVLAAAAPSGASDEDATWPWSELRAEAWLGLAQRQAASGRSTTAEATARAALETLETLATGSGADGAAIAPRLRLQAALRGVLAEALQNQGRVEEALASRLAQREHWTGLVAIGPGSWTARSSLAAVLSALGGTYLALGRSAEAAEVLGDGLALLDGLLAERPDETAVIADRARVLTQLARAAAATDRHEDCERHVTAALDSLQALAEDFPELARIGADLAGSLAGLAHARFQRGDLEGALEADQRALALLETLLQGDPDATGHRAAMARIESNLFAIRYRRGEFDAALSSLARAEAALGECRAREPDRPDHVEALLVLCVNRGYALLAQGRHREAVVAVAGLPAWPGWRERLSAAVVCVRALDLLAADGAVSEAERRELQERYAAQAVALVREGIERGFDDAADLAEEQHWAPLRGRTDFDALVEGLREQASRRR